MTCSADLSVKLWDAKADYKCVKTLMGHDHSVSSVIFSISGDMIISASRDKTIKIWETSTGFCVKTLSGHLDWVRQVRPSLDGKLLISASNDQVIMNSRLLCQLLWCCDKVNKESTIDRPCLGLHNRGMQSGVAWP